MRHNCLFIMHSHGGGGEKVCLTLLQHLPEQDYALTVACIHPLECLRAALPAHCASHFPRSAGLWDKLAFLWALWEQARRSDCVVGTLELQSIFWAALLAPRKAIGWLHKDLQGYSAQKPWLFRQIYLRLFAWSAQRCHRVVCVSESVLHSCQALFPRLAEKFIHINNPLDLHAIYEASLAPLPTSVQATFQHPVLLAVGRLVQQKNYPLLLRAHALLRQWGCSHHLCILGEGPLGPALKAQCQELGIEDSVMFAGFLSPYSPMRHARVLALASHYEGLSLVLVEALSLGLPAVSTDCPSGPREVLQNGACGTLVPVDDAQALATALRPYLGASPQGESSYSTQGKLRAQDFAVHNCLHHWQVLLRSPNASHS